MVERGAGHRLDFSDATSSLFSATYTQEEEEEEEEDNNNEEEDNNNEEEDAMPSLFSATYT